MPVTSRPVTGRAYVQNHINADTFSVGTRIATELKTAVQVGQQAFRMPMASAGVYRYDVCSALQCGANPGWW